MAVRIKKNKMPIPQTTYARILLSSATDVIRKYALGMYPVKSAANSSSMPSAEEITEAFNNAPHQMREITATIAALTGIAREVNTRQDKSHDLTQKTLQIILSKLDKTQNIKLSDTELTALLQTSNGNENTLKTFTKSLEDLNSAFTTTSEKNAAVWRENRDKYCQNAVTALSVQINNAEKKELLIPIKTQKELYAEVKKNSFLPENPAITPTTDPFVLGLYQAAAAARSRLMLSLPVDGNGIKQADDLSKRIDTAIAQTVREKNITQTEIQKPFDEKYADIRKNSRDLTVKVKATDKESAQITEKLAEAIEVKKRPLPVLAEIPATQFEQQQPE